MAAEITPESAMTPEERVDAAIASARFGQAGLGSLGTGEHFDSGGGGAGGQFVFADLATLDTVIGRWTALRDRIDKRGRKIQGAKDLCNPPADDTMSHSQADAARNTMQKKLDHNAAMLAYADAYIGKLIDSRKAMQATEQANTDLLHKAGKDLGHG